MFGATFFGFLAGLSAATSADTTMLWRTPAHGFGICGLSGRLLSVPEDSGTPIRAWAGLLIQPDGGPFAAELRLRHLKQVGERFSDWKQQAFGAGKSAEISRRIRHAGMFHPVYFDVVVIQTKLDTALQWLTDNDLDGVLEPSGTVTCIQFPREDSVATSPADWLRLSFAMTAATVEVTDAGPPEVEDPVRINKQSKSVSQSPRDETERLQRRLMTLDVPSTRKQNLSEIVTTADELIQELTGIYGSDSTQLADPLYRKGRALGYRELPDVVARTPVENPAQLDRDFEATFARLQSLVDVTGPKYVLLAVRRERRRGFHGEALDLLEGYRQNHLQPDWYHKKRSDLLSELKLDLISHQAAAELWLHGARPKRPVPIVFRMDSATSENSFHVSWSEARPWRSDKLRLRQVSPSGMECVAWLPVHSVHQVRLGPHQFHKFQTDTATIRSGSVVTLPPVSKFDE